MSDDKQEESTIPEDERLLVEEVDQEKIQKTLKREAEKALWAETVRISSVVGFYFFVSISLVFLNKNLMSEDFEFPLFITWYQLVVAIIMLWIMGHVGKRWEVFKDVPPIEFDQDTARKIFILSGVFVGMISFNNLCLLYVEVTFYQVARSLTICFTIAFTYFILGTNTSWPAVRASIIVMIGFIVGSIGEVHFSWLGIIFGVISSAFVSLYSIYVKKVMGHVGNNEWKLMIYNTILSIILMIPIIIISGEMSSIADCPLIYEVQTWINMTISGVFGFLINIAVFLQIKFTSPLTNNISGTLKACIQTLFAMIIYRNPISTVNALGIVLVIGGSFWYSQVRYREMIEKSQQKS